MTAPERLDWARVNADEAVALARHELLRADLPAPVEAALRAFEERVATRRENAASYQIAADALVTTVLGAARTGFQWHPIVKRALDELRTARANEVDIYRRALAGKVWKLYRREDGAP
jgi:hypothetical protein